MRFVVLQHETPQDNDQVRHWDLMLESTDALRTWALEQPPAIGSAIVARSLPDHRKAYLDYEGPVSGNRGHVARWDQGQYETVVEQPGRWIVVLDGCRFRARLELTARPESAQRWTARFSPE